MCSVLFCSLYCSQLSMLLSGATFALLRGLVCFQAVISLQSPVALDFIAILLRSGNDEKIYLSEHIISACTCCISSGDPYNVIATTGNFGILNAAITRVGYEYKCFVQDKCAYKCTVVPTCRKP